MYVVARTDGDPAALVPSIRRALLQVEPRLDVYEAGTMGGHMAATTASRRFTALLLASFALVALLLAALGVYGLTAYVVRQRQREVGIRLALGATATQVSRLLVGTSSRLLGLGLLLGLAGAAALVRVLRGLLFGVAPFDPVTLVAIVALLGGAGLLAAWLPARRARAVQPASALRAE